MEVKWVKYPSEEDWIICRNNALSTQRKNSSKPVSSEWKTKILVSEHSPIRSLEFIWEWIDLPYWVSVHFVRHHEGITHYVSSQRNDIQKLYDRRKAPQDSPVNHRCMANAQSIINISKARTCFNASLETRNAWNLFLSSLKDISLELFLLCVPPCIYRNGICPEVFKQCGYNETKVFERKLDDYISLLKQYTKVYTKE
jgi:hypothetical protein